MSNEDYEGLERRGPYVSAPYTYRADATGGFFVDKKVSIAVILAILIQTFGGIWWAATVTRDMEYVKETISKFDFYPSVEARMHQSRVDMELKSLKAEVRHLGSVYNATEVRILQLEAKQQAIHKEY